MPDIQTITDHLKQELPGLEVSHIENSTPAGIQVPAQRLIEICTLLHQDELTYFDQLSCLTGIDNGPEENTMEVLYHLYSIPKHVSIVLKVVLDREHPCIPTVSHIWQTANWHEREAFDLLGIQFDGHPDLRRILLPKDWVGHPLRKDYEEQETYHGMSVKYDREENE